MAGRLAGKVALLTAAAGGHRARDGRGLCGARGARGHRHGHRRRRPSKASTRTSASSTFRSTEAVEALAPRGVGPIDVLFNCAGFVHHGTVLTTSDADWDFSFEPQRQSRCTAPIHAFSAGHAGEGQGVDRQHRVGGPRRCAASPTATSTAPRRPR